jgi:muramoyltetrapeptide carboxypeptidase
LPEGFRKPRALRAGDKVAIVAPASPFAREEFDRGVAELERLGFEATYDESVFARELYVAGPPEVRAAALQRAWTDPAIAGIFVVRGGYGSVQLLPWLDAKVFRSTAKAFVAYSDNTAVMSWLTLSSGVVTFHGPMLDRRLSRGEDGYDRDTFVRCLMQPIAPGLITHDHIEVLRRGAATGVLLGGTLTQLTASLGTPFAFSPPHGFVLFIDEVGERPYRIDRMFTQLRQAGVIERAAGIVFNELPKCEEPSGSPSIRDVLTMLTRDFRGPVLFGLPSGHTPGRTLTIPFGVTVTVETGDLPGLVIEEAAVS